MRISNHTKLIEDRFGREEAIRMIARAGFDCVDLSMFDMEHGWDSPFFREDYVEYAQKLKTVAQECGVYFNQAHAPFAMDMSVMEEKSEAWEEVLFRIRRAIEVAGIVGARNIVVHPVQYFIYWNTDPQVMKQKNLEFYTALIPTAKAAGVRICIENMHRMDTNSRVVRHSVCSSPYELAEYVDMCNTVEDCFCACLDVGHCGLTGHDPVNAIHVLGSRLQAVHIHDVDYTWDMHTLPLTASMDHYAIVKALAEIGYPGEYTLEAYRFLHPFRPDFYQEAMNFMGKVTRHLVNSVAE